MLFLKARGQSRYAQSLCLSFSTHMEDVVTAPSPAPGGCTSSDSSVQQPILEIRAPRERIHARITATHVPRDEGPGPRFLDPKAGLIGTHFPHWVHEDQMRSRDWIPMAAALWVVLTVSSDGVRDGSGSGSRPRPPPSTRRGQHCWFGRDLLDVH